jgi:hypothetical protein
MLAVKAAIDSVSGPGMNPQFRDTLTHRLRIAKIPQLDLSQSGGDPGFCHLVAKSREPLCERATSIFFLVVAEFDHAISVA